MEVNKHNYMKDFFFTKIKSSLEKINESLELKENILLKDLSWVNILNYNLGIKNLLNENFDEADNFFRKAILEEKQKNSELDLNFLFFNSENNKKFELITTDILKNSDKVNNKFIGVGYLDNTKISEKLEREKINEAINLLKYSGKYYDEFNNLVEEVLFIGGTESLHIRSGSSLNMFGLIMIWCDEIHTIPYYLELLIHETAHLRLFLENLTDPLVLNNPDELYDAPFRNDSRPMIGIFHGLFVLTRIIVVMSIILEKLTPKDSQFSIEIKDKIERSKKKFDLTVIDIEKNGILTEKGLSIFQDCKNKIRYYLNHD